MAELLTTQPLVPFGVEVKADARTLGPAEQPQLRDLFARHHLLVFRDQGRLTREEQTGLMAMLGPVTPDDEVPLVANDDPVALGSGPLAFHSDHEYCPEPALGISLHAIDVADGATCTRFANGAAAHARLSHDHLQALASMSALHLLATDPSTRNSNEQHDPRWPHAVHPVVLRHPTTGAPIVYATEMQTVRIRELSRPDSDEALRVLFSVLYAPEHVLEHSWRTGDLVVWDNVALQHGRPATGEAPRTLQRVSIGKGLTSQFPNWRADYPVMKASAATTSVSS